MSSYIHTYTYVIQEYPARCMTTIITYAHLYMHVIWTIIRFPSHSSRRMYIRARFQSQSIYAPTIKLAFVPTLIDVRPSAELQETIRRNNGKLPVSVYIPIVQSTSFFPHVTCVHACFDY
jgi:hypothetical protein